LREFEVAVVENLVTAPERGVLDIAIGGGL
jgi:hypothetical protein